MDFLINEVVIIDDVLRYYYECDLVILMLQHQVVEVKFLDFNYELLDAWCIYDAVPMKFGSRDVGYWGEYCSVKCNFISSHCESHSVRIFILWPTITDDMDIFDLGALGDIVHVYERTSLSSLYVP